MKFSLQFLLFFFHVGWTKHKTRMTKNANKSVARSCSNGGLVIYFSQLFFFKWKSVKGRSQCTFQKSFYEVHMFQIQRLVLNRKKTLLINTKKYFGISDKMNSRKDVVLLTL